MFSWNVYQTKRRQLAPKNTRAHLLPPLLLALVLGGLQHLLLPQVEEVRRVGVELQSVFLVVPGRRGERERGREVGDGPLSSP